MNKIICLFLVLLVSGCASTSKVDDNPIKIPLKAQKSLKVRDVIISVMLKVPRPDEGMSMDSVVLQIKEVNGEIVTSTASELVARFKTDGTVLFPEYEYCDFVYQHDSNIFEFGPGVIGKCE
jgi:cell division septation protein DedD